MGPTASLTLDTYKRGPRVRINQKKGKGKVYVVVGPKVCKRPNKARLGLLGLLKQQLEGWLTFVSICGSV